MRYAILSDIHGNLPALEAVLSDAQAQSAQEYILLGDYFCDFPWAQETIQRIRAIPGAHILQGNKEGYLTMLAQENPEEWTCLQLAALHWSYHALGGATRKWLTELPELLTLSLPEGQLMAHHTFTHFVSHKAMQRELYSSTYTRLGLSREDFTERSRRVLSADGEFMDMLSQVPASILLFGHTHLQWSMRLGKKLLINPGSVGLPLDGMPGAAYAILEDGQVMLRRVLYDTETVAHQMCASEFARSAPVWVQLILRELADGREILSDFLEEASGGRQGSISDENWRKTALKWGFSLTMPPF